MSKAQGLSPALEEQFKHDYQDSNLTMQQLEEIYSKPMGTLWRWAFQLGVRRPVRGKKAEVTKDDILFACHEAVKRIKPIKLPIIPLPPHPAVGEAMTMLFPFADAHLGRKTETYNPEVAAIRMARLRDEIIQDVQMLKRRYNINKLIIPNLGDLVTGERVGFQMKLEDLAAVVLNQIFDIAIPICSQFVTDLLSEFNTIDVKGVPGNHGKQDRYASETFNLDTITYLGWRNWMHGIDRVNFDIESRLWYQYTDIFNLTFLSVHGDQFPCGKGFPHKGIIDKCMKWMMSLPRQFTNVLCGHFHSRHLISSSGLRVDVVPSLLSDDEWARETLGLEGMCGQTLFGITEEGIKYERTIRLDH